MDKQVFTANLIQLQRRKVLLMRIGLSLLFVTIISSAWMRKNHVDQQTMLIYKSIAIGVFAAMAYAFVTVIQNMARRLGLNCPKCGKNLSGPLANKVLSSDQCFRCGTRLF
ncbi:MAG TPA: hypothetical protein VN436_13160 [Holophaga sp.]|nr:hypothetical protein [Holophaga sp.]